MGVFDDVLGHNESLIINEDVLEYDFIPDRVPHRESEQRHLATCIKPLFFNRKGKNLFMYGTPGIGKTVATRKVLEDMSDETDEIYPLYVNCWKHNTTYKVLMEICDQLDYKFTQNKKTTDLFKVIQTIVNKKAGAFVFDEIDKAEDLDFLYFCMQDITSKTIFLLTNYKEWLINLDLRLKSRLMAETLEFRSYSFTETKSILEERVEAGFPKDVFSLDAFELVAKKSHDLKDIRIGLFLLKESAFVAEANAKKKVDLSDVESVISKLDKFTIKDADDLDTDTKIIFKIIRSNSGKKIGDLYKIYQGEGGKKGYKTFQRKIAKLEEGSYISTKKSTGSGGNTTIVEKKLNDF